MRAVLIAPTFLIIALAGCSAAPASTGTVQAPVPTPNIESTVQARVALTVAAQPKPTAAVTIAPTLQPPVPTSTPKTQAAAAVTLSGKGITQTDAFELAAGNYAIDWQARAANDMAAGCYHGGFLSPTDGRGAPQMIANVLTKTGETTSGHTNAFNLSGGRYFLNMSSGCEWQVTITRAP